MHFIFNELHKYTSNTVKFVVTFLQVLFASPTVVICENTIYTFYTTVSSCFSPRGEVDWSNWIIFLWSISYTI